MRISDLIIWSDYLLEGGVLVSFGKLKEIAEAEFKNWGVEKIEFNFEEE